MPQDRFVAQTYLERWCICIMRASPVGIVLLGMCACPAFAETTYSKTIELPPLRISFAQLQDILNKGASLMKAANSSAPLSREDMELSKAGLHVKITGNQLDADHANNPNVVDAFEYSALMQDSAPVSRLQLSFTDFRRSVSVVGQSPDQVDAIFFALRDDLSMLSSSFGGIGFKMLFGFLTFSVLTAVLVSLLISACFVTRRHILIVPILLTVTLFALDMFLAIDDLFAGFTAFRGDASFMVRYGPEIAFLALIIGVIAIPLSLIPLKIVEAMRAEKR